MPRKRKLNPDTSPFVKPEKSQEEINREKAEQVLLKDDKIQKIAQLLRESAEEGNPAARTLYGVYNMFIGANLPDRQDIAYAEALKWFFMNRKGALESRLLDELTGKTANMYAGVESVYQRACNLAAITTARPMLTMSAEQIAMLVSIPVSAFSLSEETITALHESGRYIIGALITDSYWECAVDDRDDKMLLQQVVEHLRPFVPSDRSVGQFIHQYNHS